MAAFIPAMVLGLTLNKPIKQYLFGLWPIVIAWFLGGVAILWVAGRKGQGARGRQLDASCGDAKATESMTAF